MQMCHHPHCSMAPWARVGGGEPMRSHACCLPEVWDPRIHAGLSLSRYNLPVHLARGAPTTGGVCFSGSHPVAAHPPLAPAATRPAILSGNDLPTPPPDVYWIQGDVLESTRRAFGTDEGIIAIAPSAAQLPPQPQPPPPLVARDGQGGGGAGDGPAARRGPGGVRDGGGRAMTAGVGGGGGACLGHATKSERVCEASRETGPHRATVS